MDLSLGLDFKSRVFLKPNAATRMRKELSRKRYQYSVISLGVNTDAYQSIERRLRITRSILEMLAEFGHPVIIVSKSWLLERDVDLLGPMAGQGLAQVFIPITSLDRVVSRWMEPRASAAQGRLQTIATLTAGEVNELFKVWLTEHYPLRAAHVMARIRDIRAVKRTIQSLGGVLKVLGQSRNSLFRGFA